MSQAAGKLSRWLRDEGRKQRWLAARVGCSESSLRSWLRGDAVPMPVFREALSDVTGLDLREESKWH